MADYKCAMCMELLDNPAPNPVEDVPTEQLEAGTSGTCGSSTMSIMSYPNTSIQARCGSKETKTQLLASPTDLCAISCGHIFHQKCLDHSFTKKRRKTCPKCRQPVTQAGVIRVFPSRSEGNRSVLCSGSPTGVNNNNDEAQINYSGGSADPGSRSAPVVDSRYADLHMIHVNLVSDYNELREKYVSIRDERAVQVAQQACLQEELDRVKMELKTLTKKKSSSTKGAGKRQFKGVRIPRASVHEV